MHVDDLGTDWSEKVSQETLPLAGDSLTFAPMRSSHAAIRGDRPITRFATQTAHSRAPHLGLRRTTPTRLAQAPVDTLGTKPMVAIRSAARGVSIRATAAPGAIRRHDAIVWSLTPYSVPHRARPRSAAPWRG